MICNLNQLTFRGFGAVLSERAQNAGSFPKDEAQSLTLTEAVATVYRTCADTWVSSVGGMCVLSVSEDGETFRDFYLDKSVCLRSGVQFCLSAFNGSASALMYSKAEPEQLGERTVNVPRVSRKLNVDSIYTFFYQEKEQGFLFPGESHAMPELTYVDQGELHSVVDGQDMLLKQGDLVIYGPNQWHMQYSDVGVAPRFVTIAFDACGADLSPLLNQKFAAPQMVATLLQSMLQEQERMDEFSDTLIVSQLNQLLAVLMREVQSPSGSRVKNVNVVHSENEVIRQAQQYIAAHIREKLSVPMVAKHVDVSTSYLTVLFHKHLQIAPGEYIRRIKLQESKQMIRENNLNFTEIAAVLQYSTVHHFSRQFKDKFGITPTEYARSVR